MNLKSLALSISMGLASCMGPMVPAMAQDTCLAPWSALAAKAPAAHVTIIEAPPNIRANIEANYNDQEPVTAYRLSHAYLATGPNGELFLALVTGADCVIAFSQIDPETLAKMSKPPRDA